MISFDNYVMLYESTLENCQAIDKLVDVLDFNYKHSSIFNTYNNMGWVYGCLFGHTDKEIVAFEQEFWDMIRFFISHQLTRGERETKYIEEYIFLLRRYGDDGDWEREKENIAIEEESL